MIPLLALILACDSESPAPAPAPAPEAAPAPAPAPAAVDAALPTGPRVPPAAGSRLAASHILVAYAGAVGALPNVSRSRDEARQRAEEARTRVLAGEDFGRTAAAFSDDSSASKKGYLGGFNPGVMVQAFEDATRALQVGQVSTLVETPFGFHIIRREPVVEVHAGHLLVSWKGAERAPENTTRSQAEAKTRIEEAKKALEGGTPWAEVVRKYSDGPLGDQGGDLGWFTHGQLFEPLDSTAFDLDIGATSAVLESPRGYHLLKRLE